MVEAGAGVQTKKRGSELAPPFEVGDGCGGLQAGGADPARLGDVDGDTIRRGVLHLDVAGPVPVLAHAERLVDVIAGLGAGVLQPLGDRLEALDLEADVMDAAPARTAFHAGDRVVLEVEDRQVEVAVAQVITPGARAVDLRDLLHAEHVHVELRGLVHVLGREGDVLDLRHAVSPVQVVRAPVLVPVLAGYTGDPRKARTMISGHRRLRAAGGSPARQRAECKSYRRVRSLTLARNRCRPCGVDDGRACRDFDPYPARESRAPPLLLGTSGTPSGALSRGPRVEITGLSRRQIR